MVTYVTTERGNVFTFKELYGDNDSKILNAVSVQIDNICYNANQQIEFMDSETLLKTILRSLNDMNERLNPDTPKTTPKGYWKD